MQLRDVFPILSLVLAFLLVGTAGDASWAVTAGQRGCNALGCTASACDLLASYIVGPPVSTSPRQLLAVPFRYSGQGYFQVQTVRMYIQMANAATTGSYFVFFYKPNTTDPTLPGDILDGTPATGQNVTFNKNHTVSTVNGVSVINEVVGSVTPFNLSAGTYFISAAGYSPGTVPSTSAWQFPSWHNSSVYLPGFNGLNTTGTWNPYSGSDPTSSWDIPANSQICLWPEGADHEPASTTGGTTGDSSTTGGTSSTTGGATTTTTTGGSTTGGSSGGDANPTDFVVRYTLNTDLSSWSPSDFIVGVTETLDLGLYDSAHVLLVAARRTVVTTQQARASEKRAAVGTGTNVDFYITGPDGATLMNNALSVNLTTLRANGVDIASTPTQASPDGSPAAGLRPAGLFRWLLA